MTRCLALVLVLLSTTQCTRGPDWQVFESKEGGFKIEFPGKPTPSKTYNEAMTEVQVFKLERGAAGIMQIVYFDVPGEHPPETIDTLLKIDCMHPFSGDSKFTPQKPRKISRGKIPGVSIVGIAPKSDSLPQGGWEEDRCYLSGTRLYHLIVIGPNNDATHRDAKRFLESFSLTR
jgi:hypothetical protein